MKKIAPLIIFALALVLLQNSTRIHQWLSPIPTEQLNNNDVILYSTRWCPYCAKTRDFFHYADIPFTEYDIEESASHFKEYQQYGGNGVPLIVIGPTIIRGYDPAAIRAAIQSLSTPTNPIAADNTK